MDILVDASSRLGSELLVQVQVSLDHCPAAVQGTATGHQLHVFLPTWTPGSYLIREYARHLSRVAAFDAVGGHPLVCRKHTKNRFVVELAPTVREVRLVYSVYAHELTVRTADLTDAHAFWNHACVVLLPVATRRLPIRLRVRCPASWQAACSLAPASSDEPTPAGTRMVAFQAEDIDTLCDSPVLLGELTTLSWSSFGIEHAMVVEGQHGVALPATLARDLQAIVQASCDLFGGPPPYSSYRFLTLLAADGHGGLEHAEGSVLLAGRASLHQPDGYREFSSLAAHELLHAWNVKRMRPSSFWEYDYERENYSELLWLVEGWTAYYDDLVCVRAGVWSESDYLEQLAKNINAVLAGPGRLRLSLAESSHDAWIRLYRPDENTKNSSQNYYGNGALAALCIDLAIQRATQGKQSLDDVLRAIYRETFGLGRGYLHDDVRRLVRETGGEAVAELMDTLVHGQLDPDLPTLLRPHGLACHWRDQDRAYLGVQFEANSTLVASVVRESPAWHGGLLPGDEVLALGSLRVTAARWAEIVRVACTIDSPCQVLVSRRGVVQSLAVTPRRSPGTLVIELDPHATPEAKEMRGRWLRRVVPSESGLCS